MATRTISTRIELDGEKEFKAQMSSVNGELKNMRSEMGLLEETYRGQANSVDFLTAKDKLLRDEIDQQEEKVRALEQALKDAETAYGDTDKRTDNYRQSLNKAKTELLKMNRELEDTDKYLDEARTSSDKCAKSIDEFGREAKDAGDDLGGLGADGGLGGFLSSLGGLQGMLVGGAVVGGIKELGEAVIGIVEDTEEYRRIMGTLEVSSQAAGYSAEQTTETYSRLHSVLGDTQAAATTTANLQAIGLEQEDLMAITDMAIGAWATYGDSIPIDGLAEAINETIQAGQVTGVLADVLNWAGVSEEAFNGKLASTGDKAKRTNLVMLELSRNGLAEAGQAWMDVNEEIIKGNEAQAELDAALGRLGEYLSPAADAMKSFAADALNLLVEGLQAAVEWFGKLFDVQEEYTSKMPENLGGSSAFRAAEQMDGSHAGGLNYVPFDGYRALLHQGERILTANEARTLDSLAADLRGPRPGVTAADLQNVTAAAVNALAVSRQDPVQPAKITLVTPDGRTLATWLLPDLRAAEKSDPEVVDDT